jgi:hypothetical protein
VGVFGVDTHVVVEDAVEADVVETDFLLDGGELGLPVGAKAFVGAAGAYGVEGRGGVGAYDLCGVYGEGLGRLGEAGCGKAEDEEGVTHGDEGSRVLERTARGFAIEDPAAMQGSAGAGLCVVLWKPVS